MSTWSSIGYRKADWDSPLWALPNTRAGRYNLAGESGTQYLCGHPWGPWAETLRWEDRRTDEEALDLAGRIWAVRAVLPKPPLLLGFQNAKDYGLNPDDLVAEDYRACQRFATEARAAGAQALLVPSAALPGTSNLVILGPRVLLSWDAEVVDPLVDAAAGVLADRAGCPLSVLPFVRWRGESHPALEEHEAGRAFSFQEPVPTPLL